ncbi:type II secretion system inner membrane protein GspF [Lentisalinibacter sediminis]|uniref:type II secretion system inner membrane protein GspF n=1 Tax=Lentisalinibacter sediminis TaxID=2992237 RepID=UPI003864D347
MGAFEYVALDSAGKEKKGVLEGDTARQVRQLLRERALVPLEVSEVAEKESARQFSVGLRRGFSATELALVTRQLATLVNSGMPLEETLQAVAQQTEKPRTQSILLGVRARVMEGHTLADGLEEFPQAFPEIYRATVSAGEQSGHLDAVLERLADYTETRQALRQRITNALVYPIVLVLMSLGIIAFMLSYVVPQVVGVFETTGAELPILTRLLIGISDFLREWWWLLIAGIAAVAFGVWRLLKIEGPRRRYHRLLLRLPLIGRITRGVNTARFTRTLSILAGSGVPVLEALKISAEVIMNVPMREAVQEASLRVREGGAISRSLSASRLFPPMTIHLISSGESSGQLEQMLGRAADNQEREMDGLITTMMGIMEPLLIVFMGGVVLTIVLAILLPIFQINNLIQ